MATTTMQAFIDVLAHQHRLELARQMRALAKKLHATVAAAETLTVSKESS